MIKINLEINGEVKSFEAPSSKENLRLKHFSMYLIVLKNFNKEVEKIKANQDLSSDQKETLTSLAYQKFEIDLVALMLGLSSEELSEIITHKELEQLSKEFGWLTNLELKAPEDDVLLNLPDELKLQVGEEEFILETDLDSISIGAWHKIEEVLAITVSDYFTQLHFVLAILILSKKKIYDLNEIQKLAEKIYDQVHLTKVWDMGFFLATGKKKYSLLTKVYSRMKVKQKGTQWMKIISEVVSTESLKGLQESGVSTNG